MRTMHGRRFALHFSLMLYDIIQNLNPSIPQMASSQLDENNCISNVPIPMDFLLFQGLSVFSLGLFGISDMFDAIQWSSFFNQFWFIIPFPVLSSFMGRQLLQSASSMVTAFKSIKMDKRYTFSQGICLPGLQISSFYSMVLLLFFGHFV